MALRAFICWPTNTNSPPKLEGEGFAHDAAHLRNLDVAIEFPRKGGDRTVDDPTRHDGLVVGKVTVHVQREPVGGDPSARYTDSNGGNLSVRDPNSSESLDGLPLNSVLGKRSDHHRLEVSEITRHVATVGLEVQDGISHELTRAMVRHVSAPSHLEELEAQSIPAIRVDEDVVRIRAGPQGEDVWMFQKQQLIRYVTRAPARNEIRLGLESLPVGH